MAAIDYRAELAALVHETPDDELEDLVRALTPKDREYIADLWEISARPKQIWRPGAVTTTLYLAGRGWGKTRTGAEAVHYVAARPELCGGEIAIVARTANDLHQTLIHGQSGIMACAEWRRPRYIKSDLLLVWPNGVTARLYSAEKPAAMRGPNPGFVWGDEIAHWKYDQEMYDMLRMANRGGDVAHRVFTTTPLGTPLIASLAYARDPVTKDLIPDPDAPGGYLPNPKTRIVRGHTRENEANLARGFVDELEDDYGGTRLGDQELGGAILLESPHACWSRGWIKRVPPDQVPPLVRTMVAVDPSGSQRDPAAEVGIAVVGLSQAGGLYVLADETGRMGVQQWTRRAIALAREWGAVLGAERNYGGDMVRDALARTPGSGSVRIVDLQASRSKRDRWSLAALKYEQGRVYHVTDDRGAPTSIKLEHQMTTQNPDAAGLKDRADALAWAIIGLTTNEERQRSASVWTDAAAWS